jgi:hypothetical protein
MARSIACTMGGESRTYCVLSHWDEVLTAKEMKDPSTAAGGRKLCPGYSNNEGYVETASAISFFEIQFLDRRL